MPWRVERNAELDLIEIVYIGAVTCEDVRQASAEALSLARPDLPERFLVEFEKADIRLSLADIFATPDQWKAAAANPGNRLAIVAPDSAPWKRDLHFHETVSRNRGWQVSVFSLRKDAVSWLLS